MQQAGPHISAKRLKKKQEILNSALLMVSEEGLSSVTMHGLARRLQLTQGALYRYFASKTEIVSALEGRIFQELSDGLRQTLADLPDAVPPLGRLWGCAQFYLEHSQKQPGEAGLIRQLLADPRYHVADADLPARQVEFVGLFSQLVHELDAAQACQALQPGDARRRALLFWAGLQGATGLSKLCRVDADFFDPMRAGAELLSTLLLGWGAHASAVQDAFPAAR